MGNDGDVNLLILVDGDTGQLILQEIFKHIVVVFGGLLIRMTFHG